MAPRPYSDRAALPNDSSVNESITSIPTQVLPESPSLSTLSSATTPSPPPPDIIVTEQYVETVDVSEEPRMYDTSSNVPCYPTPDDIMPYDHSLPDFIRQITNQSNLANLQSLSLRVISTLISLHRMASYLPNLRELDLEGSVLNSLRDIGCSLKNLQILKVGRCQLESLDGTFGLSSLRELYAQKNFITDVSPCSNLPHIRHIDVSGNRIRNISYAGFLSMCSKLKSIVFTGNPATEVPGYRKHVRRILPQLEYLDGVSFQSEDGGSEDAKEVEAIEFLSDSSAEVPDFSSVSPTDSMNNLLDFEEDVFALDKKNKQAKNLANQDNFDSADQELQDLLAINDLQDDFKNMSLQNQLEKRADQIKLNDNKNLNIKQKSPNIQKLDKDLENRSKKSSLISNIKDFPCSSSGENFDYNLPSTSTSIQSRDNKDTIDKKLRPSTASCSSSTGKEVKGGVKKRPTTATHSSSSEEEKICRPGQLTSGTPVCGNLTAALRNRKKLQNCWNEKKQIKTKNLHLEESMDESTCKELLAKINGSGDTTDAHCSTENEEDFIQEDILTTSKKWREEFRRYRSNNRARWEEEDNAEYSSFLKETIKEDLGTPEPEDEEVCSKN